MAYLDAVQAAAFLRFRSASGVRNAVMRGELVPVGRGSRRCLLFTMEELQRFVRARGERYAGRGDGARNEEGAVTAAGQPGPAPDAGALRRKTRRPRRSEAPPSFREIVARVKDQKPDSQAPRLRVVRQG